MDQQSAIDLNQAILHLNTGTLGRFSTATSMERSLAPIKLKTT